MFSWSAGGGEVGSVVRGVTAARDRMASIQGGLARLGEAIQYQVGQNCSPKMQRNTTKHNLKSDQFGV